MERDRDLAVLALGVWLAPLAGDQSDGGSRRCRTYVQAMRRLRIVLQGDTVLGEHLAGRRVYQWVV